MHVTQLAIYPIKSIKQVFLQMAKVTLRGFKNDRRWMLVDHSGKFLTQRRHHTMALISANIDENGLLITKTDCEQLRVNQPSDHSLKTTVTVWEDSCQALDAGDQAAEWFSNALNLSCRLVYQTDDFIRPTSAHFSKDGDHTSFADGFPFLLTNEASLQELNSRLPKNITMTCFRPNIVVNSELPYEEDNWKVLQIGDITFRVVKPCSRCIMTTIDPETAKRNGTEPLATLSKYRKTNMGIIFGQNLIPDQEGIIKVGDEVTILE